MKLQFDWCRYTYDPAHEEPHNRAVLRHFGITDTQIDQSISNSCYPAFDNIVMLAGYVANSDISSRTAQLLYHTIRKIGSVHHCKIADLDDIGDNATVEAYKLRKGKVFDVVLINYLSGQYEVVTTREAAELLEADLKLASANLPELDNGINK